MCVYVSERVYVCVDVRVYVCVCVFLCTYACANALKHRVRMNAYKCRAANYEFRLRNFKKKTNFK